MRDFVIISHNNYLIIHQWRGAMRFADHVKIACVPANGGRIALLDLVKHDFEAARELYADVWPGFSQVELLALLREAGFVKMDVAVVDIAEEAPRFETIMALAEKPGAKRPFTPLS